MSYIGFLDDGLALSSLSCRLRIRCPCLGLTLVPVMSRPYGPGYAYIRRPILKRVA